MNKHRSSALAWMLALFLGLAWTAGEARGDMTVRKKSGKKTSRKGKSGAACKKSTDCDQVAQPQACVEARCRPIPISVPPT